MTAIGLELAGSDRMKAQDRLELPIYRPLSLRHSAGGAMGFAVAHGSVLARRDVRHVA